MTDNDRFDELTEFAVKCQHHAGICADAGNRWSHLGAVLDHTWHVPLLPRVLFAVAARYRRRALWWVLREAFFIWMRDAPATHNFVDPSYCTAAEAAEAMDLS